MISNGPIIVARWGGNIIRDEYTGYSYEGGDSASFTLTDSMTHKELCLTLYDIMRLDRRAFKMALQCSVPSDGRYIRVAINGDESLDVIRRRSHGPPRISSLDVYVVVAERTARGRVQSSSVGQTPQMTQDVYHPSPIYGNPSSQSYSTPYAYSTPYNMHGNYSFQPYGSTFHPYSSNSAFQTQSNTSLPYGGITHVQESQFDRIQSHQPQLVAHEYQQPENQTQYSTIAEAGNERPMSPIAATRFLVDNDPGIAEEVDTDEVLHNVENGCDSDGVDDDDVDEANATLPADDDVPDPSRPDYGPPSAYFTDSSQFNHTSLYETGGMVRSSCFDPKTDELRKCLLFKDKVAMVDAVAKHHIYNTFQLKVVASNKSMYEARCLFKDSTNCQWRLRGSRHRHGLWEIATYRGPHTCVRRDLTKDHAQLTSGLISRDICHFVSADPAYKIVSIMVGVNKEYGVTPNYFKIWYAKQLAISTVFGEWDKSYNDLPKFLLAIQQYNPGTIVEWETIPTVTPNEVIFDKIFWAFKACIDAFQHCRPIVSIDATFLYGKYTGNLMIAMSKDGNNMIVPLAFAVVEKESKDNWRWFLQHVREHVARDRMDLCLIADRHLGILSAVADDSSGWGPTYRVHHRFCLLHVQANFHKTFGNPELRMMMYEAGMCTEIRLFDKKMEKIEENDTTHGKQAWNWLKQLPVHKWTLAHDGGRRHGEMLTNISECFNGVLKSARFLPITACVQVIFFRCVDYFQKRSEDGVGFQAGGNDMTPHGILELTKAQNASLRQSVRIFNRMLGEGTVYGSRGSEHQVHLKDATCSCGKWEAFHFPCSHAVSMCTATNISTNAILPSWCSIRTYIDTWVSTFHPIRNKHYWLPWTGPTWLPNKKLLRGKGRRNNSRIHTAQDQPSLPRQVRKCSMCGLQGHNKKRCPLAVQQRPSTIQFATGMGSL